MFRLIKNQLCISRATLLRVYSVNTVDSAIKRGNITPIERGWYIWESVVEHGWGCKINEQLLKGEEPKPDNLYNRIAGCLSKGYTEKELPAEIMIETIQWLIGQDFDFCRYQREYILEISRVYKELQVPYWCHSEKRLREKLKETVMSLPKRIVAISYSLVCS